MDCRHAINRQRQNVVRVALLEPLVSIPKTNHFVALIDRFNRSRTDHAIDAGRRSAANQQSEPAQLCRTSHWRGSMGDRKSTRLNSSHGYISYAVFCLKKKKKKNIII